MDPVSVCLLIQEFKHVFDGEGQSASAMDCAEQRLEEVVNKFLQCSLEKQGTEVKEADFKTAAHANIKDGTWQNAGAP